MAKRSAVQSLYQLCNKTFTSSAAPPSPAAILKLSSLMDAITPNDVGLKSRNLDDDAGHGFFSSNLDKNASRAGRWAQPITYLHIYECDRFSICIFCLPTSAVIPLHDHPGMTVLSKLLYGSLHVQSYDWLEPRCFVKSGELNKSPVRLAKRNMDTVLTAPHPTDTLYPKSGNLHCFTAITPCAFLDVLAPPYSEDAGRFCTYYNDYPYSTFTSDNAAVSGNDEEYAWLEAIPAPQDLYMRSGKYTGPPVQEEFCFPGSCVVV